MLRLFEELAKESSSFRPVLPSKQGLIQIHINRTILRKPSNPISGKVVAILVSLERVPQQSGAAELWTFRAKISVQNASRAILSRDRTIQATPSFVDENCSTIREEAALSRGVHPWTKCWNVRSKAATLDTSPQKSNQVYGKWSFSCGTSLDTVTLAHRALELRREAVTRWLI